MLAEQLMRRLERFQEGEFVEVDDTFMAWVTTGRITKIEKSMRFIDGKPVKGNQVLSMTIECEGLREPLVISKKNISQFVLKHQKA